LTDLDFFLSCDLTVKIKTRGKWKAYLTAPNIMIHWLYIKLAKKTNVNIITSAPIIANDEKIVAITGTGQPRT
jgi:hypothetical protein